MPTIDVSGLTFFMPVFSFLLVTFIVYAILLATKILGDNKLFLGLVSVILGVVFICFSSLELYVRTVTPWVAVLIVVVFFVLLVGGFAGGKVDWIAKTWFGILVIILVVIIFLIAAIKVFNPVLHPDLIITGGEDGPGIIVQLEDFFNGGRWLGSILILIVAVLVVWYLGNGG